MMRANSVEIVRWIARIWAVASVLFIGVFVFGGHENAGKWPTPEEWIGLAFFPVGLLAGLAIACWRELIGGVVTLGSLGGFYVWYVTRTGQIPHGPWFLILGAPAFLFILTDVLSRSGTPRRQDAMS